MFRLPLDPAKADPAAANEILKAYIEAEKTIQQQDDESHDAEESLDLVPEYEMDPMDNPKQKWAVND